MSSNGVYYAWLLVLTCSSLFSRFWAGDAGAEQDAGPGLHAGRQDGLRVGQQGSNIINATVQIPDARRDS